jgi:hypothetical protein
MFLVSGLTIFMADVGANFSQFLSALVKYEENIELFW